MKNRSKKLSLLAILAVAAVSLASCGKKPEEIKLTETETQTETKATEAVRRRQNLRQNRSPHIRQQTAPFRK